MTNIYSKLRIIKRSHPFLYFPFLYLLLYYLCFFLLLTMDLSWCIICDRHCVDNSLYCSESCRFQDIASNYKNKPSNDLFNTSNTSLVTPPASPELTPFLYTIHNHRRCSTTNGSFNQQYQHFPYKFTPGSPSESSLYADDT